MASGLFKVKVLNSTGKVVANLTRARDIRVGLRLSGTPSASFKLDIDDPKATDAILSTGVNDIEIYRNATKVFRGRIWNKTKNYDGDEGDIKVDAYGYFALLDKRLAGKDAPREFSATDAGAIASTLISESQAETGGSLGITQGAIQASTTRTRSYRYKRLSEAISELADAETGFDFEINASNVFNVYYPFQGSTKRNIIFKYPGAIEKVEQIDQSGEIINFRVGLGKAFGETEIRTRDSDADSIIIYGRREDVANYRDVDNVTTLGNMISGDILRSKNLVAVYRITVNQDSSEYEYGDWNIGDTVVFKVDTEKWNLHKSLRILAVEFQIDGEGRETVVFTTGEVGAEGVAGGATRPAEIPSIPAEIAEIKSRIEKTELNQPRGLASIIVAPSIDDGDYTDIQQAIDYVNSLGGGTVLIKAGTYVLPAAGLSLYSNIYLIGEDSERVIIDGTSDFGTHISIQGTTVTSSGTVSLTPDSDIVTGSSTLFQTAGVQAGDSFMIANTLFDVKSVESETLLTITIPYRGVSLSGEVIVLTRRISNVSLRGLTIKGRVDGNVSVPILIQRAKYIKLENVNVIGGEEVGIIIVYTHMFDLSNITVSGIVIQDNLIGAIYINGLTVGGNSSQVVGSLRNVTAFNNNGNGIKIAESNAVSLANCNAFSNSLGGIAIQNTSGVSIEGCFSSFNRGDGIILKDADRSRIGFNHLAENGGYGINIFDTTSYDNLLEVNTFDKNTSGDISDPGTGTIIRP